MSKRIPMNGFGMPLYSTSASSLSKPKANQLYVNTGGDKMTGDLNMGGFQISNMETPIDPIDVSMKAYVDQQLQLMKTILQAEVDQHDNNITYKIRIQANITNVIASLMVPIERIMIQRIWLKSGNNSINATHNDYVKYIVTFENGHLYFTDEQMKKVYWKLRAYCKDIKDFIKMNSFNHCEKLQTDPFMCLIVGGFR